MVHHVFACKSNVGDWLSARGIQALLAPLAVKEYLCDEPFVPETLERLSGLGPQDLVVIGGGGLFMDYFTPFWEGFQPLSRRIPFCLWGVGYCDLKSRDSRGPADLLAQIVRRSRLCVVRDELTREYLGQPALPPPIPCPSLVALEPYWATGRGILHACHDDAAGGDVCASTHSIAAEFAQRTGRSYREIDHNIPDGDESALASTLQRYADADVVVSSRLHGCIIGTAMGCRVVAVAADRKVEAYMGLSGLGDWVCEPEDAEGPASRLAAIDSQQSPQVFVKWARAENRKIADRVRRIAQKCATSTTLEAVNAIPAEG